MLTYLLATDRPNSVLQSRTPGTCPPHTYTPYGSSIWKERVRSGFSGQIRDLVPGYYHLGNGHRLFNTRLMRFSSPDALSPFDQGGNNGYAYCAGDPINRHDPTGAMWEFLKEMGQQLKTSFLRNSVPGAIAGRVLATPEAQQIVNAENKSFFGERVAGAYIAKDSNGANTLPHPLLAHYLERVKKANSGQISSVHAHLEMASTWMNFHGTPDAVAANITSATIAAAVLSHLLGAATAGGADIAALKTGRALTLSDTVDTIRK
jgi:RHS repeat-associated protein